MKKVLRKCRVLTLKEPKMLPDITDCIEELEFKSYTGSVYEIDTDRLFCIFPEKDGYRVYPYREFIGRYYFKPIIPLFLLHRKNVRKRHTDLYKIPVYRILLFNVVEKRIVKWLWHPDISSIMQAEKTKQEIAKTDFFAPPVSKYTFGIDWKLIDNIRFTAYHILENAISKKHKYLIRPKLLIEQYDYPVDVFDKSHNTIAWVRPFEIYNFSILDYIPLERDEDIYNPPNAFIFIRNLKAFIEDFKETILHELAHFVEYRILQRNLNHNETFHDIVRLLKKGYKTSYIERRLK